MSASLNPLLAGTKDNVFTPPLTNQIGMKPIGLSVNTGFAGSGVTFSVKMAAPGDFDAVRLVIYHHETTGTTAYKAIAAVTDEERTDTDAHKFRPTVAGTEYTALDATSEAYGWKSMTFGGSSSTTPSAASATVPTVAMSDWLPLSSVPRRDGSAFPFVLIRMSALSGTCSTLPITSDAATAANGGFIVQARYKGDTTGALVTSPATDLTSAGTAMPTIGVQFRCRKRGISLLGIGDSITQNRSVLADGLTSLGWRAAAAISALGIPCGYVNHGYAGQTIQVYQPNGLTAITNWKPNAVFLASLSPNNAPFSSEPVMRYEVQRAGGASQEFISTAIANNALPMIATAIPCSSGNIGTAAIDAYRVAYNQRTRAMNGGTYVLDWDALFSDNASPARILAQYQYDTTHPNEAGVALQAVQLVNVLRQAFKF